MLSCTVESSVASTWMKPLIFRTSSVRPPPPGSPRRGLCVVGWLAAKDNVRVTVDSSTTSYREDRCASTGPTSAAPITIVARARIDMPIGWGNLEFGWTRLRQGYGAAGYPVRMAKAKKRAPRRKKAAAGSVGLSAIDTATVDTRELLDLTSAVKGDGGA